MAQDGSKMAPTWPQDGPKMSPRGGQEGLERGPKRVQIGLPKLANIEAPKKEFTETTFPHPEEPKNETPQQRFHCF